MLIGYKMFYYALLNGIKTKGRSFTSNDLLLYMFTKGSANLKCLILVLLITKSTLLLC